MNLLGLEPSVEAKSKRVKQIANLAHKRGWNYTLGFYGIKNILRQGLHKGDYEVEVDDGIVINPPKFFSKLGRKYIKNF